MAQGVVAVACRHLGVDLIHQMAESGIEAVARVAEGDGDLGDDLPGMRGEQQDAIAHEHRLLDVMGDDQHRLDG
ncbi:Uncharacterised protein [Edwardsiella tarda]|nr:Uncharacterised protein [Edwardsiella tarda]